MQENLANECSSKELKLSRRIDQNNILWIPIQSVNPHLICGLCQGYLYEACTITECMHSFCKNCIVKHLERSLNCPMCAILIHPTDPFVHIRLDGLLQDIVYALLPHLEKEELKREKAFFEKHKKEVTHVNNNQAKVQPKTSSAITSTPIQKRSCTPVSHRNSFVPPVSLCLQCLEPKNSVHKLDKQYVRVTGCATINNLMTFLKKKLHIQDSHRVALYCPCRSGFVCLSNSHTLKAVKDLYCHDKDILELNYDVSEQS
ncbi:polycomb group RING finger protein 3-like [Physella acuta]|uniref:polycomb group RING finger protein 3-like n=1 Tax=Physella acuta TaxID=109671 RepID=UPI0027DDB597|nr:polycomb group RING finger protein 3-like [Physella acuta]XP_059174244.1 polycomb group RING finger protein 3-like [Physella acuta]